MFLDQSLRNICPRTECLFRKRQRIWCQWAILDRIYNWILYPTCRQWSYYELLSIRVQNWVLNYTRLGRRVNHKVGAAHIQTFHGSSSSAEAATSATARRPSSPVGELAYLLIAADMTQLSNTWSFASLVDTQLVRYVVVFVTDTTHLCTRQRNIGLAVARLPAAREGPGSNRAADRNLCFHENHCDTQL